MNEPMKTSEVNNDNDVSASKRSVLKAAWVAPVVVAVSLPRSGYAANISGTSNQGKAEEHKGHQKGHHKD